MPFLQVLKAMGGRSTQAPIIRFSCKDRKPPTRVGGFLLVNRWELGQVFQVSPTPVGAGRPLAAARLKPKQVGSVEYGGPPGILRASWLESEPA